jgi:bifunctional non-homologous end joining protein LigD
MSDFLKLIPDNERDRVKRKPQPSWFPPMLATLTENYFSDKNWIYERKFDGERVLVFRNNKGIRLLSRNKTELNDTYPEIEKALIKQKSNDFVIDGEIVAFEGTKTSFERLQRRMGVHDREEAMRVRVRVFYYVFDILHLEGYDLTSLSQLTRKQILKEAISFHDPMRYVIHRKENGLKFHRDACMKGWEGVIAKDTRSVYQHKRSKSWLKFKCMESQELIIIGYSDPHGGRTGFGAIMVGYYDEGELQYAGKVGTGFDEVTLDEMYRKMSRLEIEKSPLADKDVGERGVHWIKPKLIAQVGFTEWTGSGALRHPRFLGLRDDKNAKDVIREKPEG